MKYKICKCRIFNFIFASIMLRHFLTLVLLVSHVNVSMFIAQLDEVDIYDAKGRPYNDINTLTEYIHDVLLHRKNKPRQDEDDDNARYFQVSTSSLYDLQHYKVKVTAEDFSRNKNEYSLFKENKWFSPFLEITLPPPKHKC
ncbi:MAG TPA: hypothetical protein VET23_00005 [Chitinophagaceae bacterium]|nr:hypothetical protein [Chitinophagaceae bacterium]